MPVPTLPLSRQIAYAFGMMGWSIMINLVSVILVYLYLPPEASGIPKIITQAAIFGIFNVIAIITAGGRLIDAFYDPFIAHFSDKSKNPKGRRIPLMKIAVIPSLLFCCMVFYPLKQEESVLNIVWLAIMLIGFYISSTTYIIPYNALLPELAPTSQDKIRLATWQSAGYILGIAIASNAFNLAIIFQHYFHIQSKITALQMSVFFIAFIAAMFKLITVYAIDEKKFSRTKPSAVPMKIALKQTLANKNFLLFIAADFSYFVSGTFITSGLLYFITVLLRLEESMGSKIMISMVAVSLMFYPLIILLAKKFGKKVIIIISFFIFSLIFLGIFFLGKMPVDASTQLYLLVVISAIPMATSSILPNAILAEIIEKDNIENNQSKEALYFAVRYFFAKIGQTLGIALFSIFLLYGKDIGNDFGIRLNGIIGCVLCFLAALVFTRFKEATNTIKQKPPPGANKEDPEKAPVVIKQTTNL
jgi:GPH family glycoside/pentoside/hexuronide:cation symporter